MNLIDGERFCQILCESGLEDVCFSEPEHETKTYFEDTESQEGLVVYNLENVNDVRRRLDTILAEEGFGQLKEECVKAIVKSLISWEDEGDEAGNVKEPEIRIPEFIYSF